MGRINKSETLRVLNTKVSEEAYFRFQLIGKRNHMEPYGLLQLFVHSALRCSDEAMVLDPRLEKLFSMFDNFEGWKNITPTSGTGERKVTDAIYFFREKGKQMKAAMMVTPQFMSASKATYNAAEMIEALLAATFPGLLKRLKRIGEQMDCHNLFETVLELTETYDRDNDPDRKEIMQMFSDTNRGDFGQEIDYSLKYRRHNNLNTKEDGKGYNIQSADLFEGMADDSETQENTSIHDV